jgi:DNA-binding NarL/FixJ family response regulator
MNIRVVVIDDHPLILKAIVDELDSQPDIEVVGKSELGSDLHRLAREQSPDVVILDLSMSKETFEPVTAVRGFVENFPEIKVLVLTALEDDLYVHHIIDAGATGYLFKSDDLSLSLPAGVRTVYEGKRFYSPAVIDKLFTGQRSDDLTEQEMAVLRLAADGLANAVIAQTLGLSDKRVRNVFSTIYRKMSINELKGVNMRVAAISKARRLGLLPEEK